MNRNFDKTIIDALNHPPQFPVDEERWAKIEQALDEEDKKRPLGGYIKYIGWAVIYLLPFLLLSGYFISKQKNSNKEIQTLQTKIHNLEQEHKNKDLSFNSSRRTTYHHYDTVYHIVNRTKENVTIENSLIPKIIYNSSRFNGFFNWSQNTQNSFSFAAQKLHQVGNTSSTNHFSQLLRSSIHDKKVQDITPKQRYASIDLDQLPNRKLGLLSMETAPPTPYNLYSSKKKKKRINPADFLRPKDFNLNGSYTNLYPKIPQATSLSGNVTGLLAELEFSKNLRMNIGLEYMQLAYKIDDKATLSEKYPQVTPDDPNDVLAYMKADLKYIQVPIGMKYIFRPRSDLRPMIGFSMVSRRPTKQLLSYEYLGIMNEYYVDRTFTSSPFTLNSYSAGIGFEYDLYHNLSMTLMGTYYKDFKQNQYEFELLEMYGLQFGATYSF